MFTVNHLRVSCFILRFSALGVCCQKGGKVLAVDFFEFFFPIIHHFSLHHFNLFQYFTSLVFSKKEAPHPQQSKLCTHVFIEFFAVLENAGYQLFPT